MSFRASQRLNIVAALFTFYLVSTAWLTVQRKPKEMGSVEFGLLLVGFAVGIIALTFTWQAGHGGGQSASYLIFASVALLSTSGDSYRRPPTPRAPTNLVGRLV